jgi:polysaccharide transporter, PST family
VVVRVDAEKVPDLHRVRSLVAMYAIHGINVGLPLVTLPVITRTLGPSDYGRYGVMLNWLAMGVIFIEFGLGIHATKQIADTDDDGRARSELATTIVHQTVNALCVLPLIGLAAWLWMRPVPDPVPLALMLGGAWALGLSTLWYRVARSRVPHLLPATLIAKVTNLIVVLTLLPSHPSLTIALCANFASGFWPVLDLWPVRRDVWRAIRAFRTREWLTSLRRSFAIPLQRVGSAVYFLLPATLVASFFGLKVAGWYVLSDRIIRAGTGLFQPLTSTLFPLQLEVRDLPSDAPARHRLHRYLLVTIGASVFASLFTFVVAEHAVRLVGGEAFVPAALFLRWMSPLLMFITINMALTNQLYVLDRGTVVARAVWLSASSFAVAIFVVGKQSPALFAACCTLVEAMVGAWLLLDLHLQRARVALQPIEESAP